jgi:hypothetical protein
MDCTEDGSALVGKEKSFEADHEWEQQWVAVEWELLNVGRHKYRDVVRHKYAWGSTLNDVG